MIEEDSFVLFNALVIILILHKLRLGRMSFCPLINRNTVLIHRCYGGLSFYLCNHKEYLSGSDDVEDRFLFFLFTLYGV